MFTASQRGRLYRAVAGGARQLRVSRSSIPPRSKARRSRSKMTQRADMTLRRMSRRMSQILERLNERKRRAKKAAAREVASQAQSGKAQSGKAPIYAGNDNVRSGEPRKDS